MDNPYHMSAKITYLLGAGASANALPLIKKGKLGNPGLPENLKSFLEMNRDAIQKHNSNFSIDFDQLLEIATQSVTFGTPDLYAKYLMETGADQKYNLLKRLLSNFFSYCQSVHPSHNITDTAPMFDFRALTFLTTISENQELPDSIKIISWNYDWQIEMAAGLLKHNNSGGSAKIRNFSTWPNISDGENFRNKDPFLFHLNGIAGYDYSASNLAEKSGDYFDFSKIEIPSLLSFAWEEDDSQFGKRTFLERRLELAKKMVIGTQILVVIGYSFPFFNRKVDDAIFASMKESLYKIYFQDPNSNGKQLISQFDLRVHFPIIHIENVDNYYVPFEF